MIDEIADQISRGKVSNGVVGVRTMLGATGLDREAFSAIELLLPPGYVAIPLPDADVLLVQVNGQRDHKVALGGDHVEDTIALAPGEIGLSRGGQTVILRTTGVEIITPLKVTITAASDVTITSSTQITLAAPEVYVGGATGAKKIALDGDPVTTGGNVVASSTQAKGL